VNILTAILNTLTVVVCVFLICLILIQRGKGGGLAGAFGGVGGSSAFGTKSGDVFTKVTIVVASIWIVLSMLMVILYNQKPESAFDDGTATSVSTVPKKKTTADKSKLKDSEETTPGADTGKIEIPSDTPAPKAPTEAPVPIPEASKPESDKPK
jgi:preprotein translocase subunit SecG